jgi:murein DD-endopeptidase MepM/ murein hydrolase activator NlpD
MTINIPENQLFPLMGEPLTSQNSLEMNFTATNANLIRVDLKNTFIFNEFVFDLLKHAQKKFGYGGYLENRVIYRRSDHFQKGESRCFHLGIDIWTQAGEPVYCPFDATIHSYANNDNFGDYGPTIILEHTWEDKPFFTLYGHLSVDSLINKHEGQVVKSGEKFCEIGPYPENGDWPPHLHFQVMNDMLEKKGDFPGVCSASELHHFQNICLDPSPFVKIMN